MEVARLRSLPWRRPNENSKVRNQKVDKAYFKRAQARRKAKIGSMGAVRGQGTEVEGLRGVPTIKLIKI